jgi:phosphoserine phosphatase
MTINVYDFDGTLYDGDSTADFYKLCLKNYPKTWFALPKALFGLFLFAFGIVDKTAFKQQFFSFLAYVPDVDGAVSSFWNKNERKLKIWYLAQKRSSDVIISASPDFLLAPISQKLGVRLVASRIDKRTGAVDGGNCYGDEKVKRFTSEFGKDEIAEFYSDSLSDKPLAEMAKKAYLVRKNTIKSWEVSRNG